MLGLIKPEYFAYGNANAARGLYDEICNLIKEVYANVPPEDAHAPRRQTEPGGCPVKKIVVRVRI